MRLNNILGVLCLTDQLMNCHGGSRIIGLFSSVLVVFFLQQGTTSAETTLAFNINSQ